MLNPLCKILCLYVAYCTQYYEFTNILHYLVKIFLLAHHLEREVGRKNY